MHEYTVGTEGLFSLPLRLRVEEQCALLPTDAAADRTEEMEQNLLRRLETETDGETWPQDMDMGEVPEETGSFE